MVFLCSALWLLVDELLLFYLEKLKLLLFLFPAADVLPPLNAKTQVDCSLKYALTNCRLLLSVLQLTYINKINSF